MGEGGKWFESSKLQAWLQPEQKVKPLVTGYALSRKSPAILDFGLWHFVQFQGCWLVRKAKQGAE